MFFFFSTLAQHRVGGIVSAHRQPQPSPMDNLGMKITQSFTSASWPWGAASGGEAEAGAKTNAPDAENNDNTAPATGEGSPAAPTAAGDVEKGSSSTMEGGVVVVADQPSSAGAVGGAKRSSTGVEQPVGPAGEICASDGGSHGDKGGGVGVNLFGGGIGRMRLGAAGSSTSGNDGKKKITPVPAISLFDLEGPSSNDSLRGHRGDGASGRSSSGEGGGAGDCENGDVAEGCISPAFSGACAGGSVAGEAAAAWEKRVTGERRQEDRDGVRRRRGAGAMLCRRCGGTVEGPLHSTCICSVREREMGGRVVGGVPRVRCCLRCIRYTFLRASCLFAFFLYSFFVLLLYIFYGVSGVGG